MTAPRPVSTAEEDRRLLLRWARQWRSEIPSHYRLAQLSVNRRIRALQRAATRPPFSPQ